MKPHEFIDTDLVQSLGPRERITKQLSKARKINPGVYPAGKKGNCPDVYSLQACRALMLLIYNPTPSNTQEVKEVMNRITQMDPFINDLSWILENDGETLSGQEVKAVFVCTERAFAKIEFEDGQSRPYGDSGKTSQIENYTVLRPEVLKRLSHLMKTTPRDA
jgi:hypothetical protein